MRCTEVEVPVRAGMCPEKSPTYLHFQTPALFKVRNELVYSVCARRKHRQALYRATALNRASLNCRFAARGFRNEPIFIEFGKLQAAVPDAFFAVAVRLSIASKHKRPQNRAYVNDR